MIQFSRNDSLINSDVLPPAGGLISNNLKYQYSMFYV